MRGRCSQCQKPAPGYDQLAERCWLFVPLWGIPTHFRYAPRRVECAEHGVVVEQIPWSEGKRPVTRAMMGFLARWARRLSWRETAQVFQTSWEAVYRSVEWFVQWGMEQRQLQQVWSIGIDEIHWGQGKRADQFLTVIYQIDSHCRRLLWVGRRRTQATLRRGLQVLGSEVVKELRFVCSDMWQPYLTVMAAEASQALHVLDRFHITTHLNQAVDQVRRGESTRLRAEGKAAAQRLKHMRWTLLRRESGTGASPAKTAGAAGQQTGDGTGVGAERDVSTSVALPIPALGQNLSRLLVYPGYAQPLGAHEESGPHAPCP
jgi:transposase